MYINDNSFGFHFFKEDIFVRNELTLYVLWGVSAVKKRAKVYTIDFSCFPDKNWVAFWIIMTIL